MFATLMLTTNSCGVKVTIVPEAKKAAAGLELNAKAVALGLTIEEHKDKEFGNHAELSGHS